MRVAGFDSGKHLGWCLLTIERGIPRHVDSGVELIVTGDDVLRAPMRILHALGAPLDVVGVEVIVGKAHGEGDAARAAAKSRNLVHASRVTGSCEQAAFSMGWPVDSFPATAWRKAIVGNPFASDREIAAVLALRIRGIPRSNAHKRDAMGVALFAALRRQLSLAQRTA